jgi:N-acetylglutamate synthase
VHLPDPVRLLSPLPESVPRLSNPPGLGPHCVGLRVVVRRVLPGRTGPTGGPAMTDLLGVMESWSAEETTIRDESGALTSIALAHIVTGKPVPPRPSVRMRVSPEDAEHRALGSWPAPESVPLGSWVLRAAEGFSSRANSVLAAGDPGVPFEAALERAVEFYTRRALPVWAQVVTGSDAHTQFEHAGWVPARPGEDDTLFQLGSVALAARALRGVAPRRVEVGTTVPAAWLAADERARSHGAAALAVLEGPAEVGFVSVHGDGGPLLARGRAALSGDWAGLTDIWVAPDQRRRGLALVVMQALVAWAAERGAGTAFLQVRADNPAGLALYDRLGFRTHHAYRYLTPGQPPAAGPQ